MQDMFNTALDSKTWPEWVEAIAAHTGEQEYVEPLGPQHAAIFVGKGTGTLLVSFESHHRIEDISDKAQPIGWQMAQALNWSHLCLACEKDTWFRDQRVFGYFDRLIDDGFFEEYEQVIFYGAGPCGYAAAAFSVAAPGARVLALQPQATLDPRVAEWDDRFMGMRRTAFDDRFGYAPDMLDAASGAVILYDPEIELDAMHAALFTRSNVLKYRMRHIGPRMDSALARMNILLRILAQFSAGKLNRAALSKLWRARRTDGSYQYNLLKHVTRDDRHQLTVWLAAAVLQQRQANPFRKALVRASNALAAQKQAEQPGTL